MAIRNANWYASHGTRKYPLADTATGLSDEDARLPDDIITDCRLRWPPTAGQYAYIGGITVTSRLVTLTFVAAETPYSVAGYTPLGVVSIPQPVAEGRHYAIEPQLAGVGGFIVFGDVSESFVGRFSSPVQTLLLPDVAHPTRELPIPTLRRLGRNVGLDQLVKLVGGNDVEVVAEEVTIDGEDRDAIVVRLVQGNFSENVLSRYIGPCGVRPESNNCDKPGIEQINDVTPDCDGNINIEFQDVSAGPYESCGEDIAGVTLDQNLGLDDVCADRDPGRFIGDDLCDEGSLSSGSAESISSSAGGGGGGDPGSSVSVGSCSDVLPFVETFDAETAADFDVVQGSFDFAAADSPDESGGPTPEFSYMSTSGARRNVSVLDNCAVTDTLDKRCTVHVALTNTYAEENAGVVINYHEVDPIDNPHIEYFIAEINRRVNRVRLLRFNGTGLVLVHEATPARPFVLDHWYEIVVETSMGASPIIAVDVQGVTDPTWGSVSFSVSSNQYLPSDDGQFGVGTDRAQSYCSFFVLEDI